jgi:TIR domain-containing protein/PDZ domain-containing protein
VATTHVLTHDHGPGSPGSSGAGFIFLSYAAEDVKAARGLAEYLESRGWSVWWDRKIPAGHTFDEAIEKALTSARCAVVLWTRAAVASRWVRAEASEALHRDILVPVLLEDVQIPLEFRLVQAVDLRGWKQGDIASLAPLHEAIARVAGGLPPDDLARHEQNIDARPTSIRRPSSSTATLVLLGLTLVALAASGGWYFDAFYREHVDYYAGVTTRWGLPEGLGWLTASQVARRNVSIAVVRRGRRSPADELRLVNSAGNTPPLSLAVGVTAIALSTLNPLSDERSGSELLESESLQSTRVTFSRDSHGQVLEQTAFNRGGRRLYTIRFAEADLGEYKRQGFGAQVRASGISYLRFSRIKTGPHDGRLEKVLFLDDKQQPQPDEDGSYGYRIVLDSAGHEAQKVNLGADGEDKPDHKGVLKFINSYDASGNLTEGSPVDEHGALVASRQGAGFYLLRYDEVGNTVQMSLFDTHRVPMTSQSVGSAGLRFAYDDHGNVSNIAYLGVDGKPVRNTKFGTAGASIEWLTATRSIHRFFDAAGRPQPGPEGAFQDVQEWDRNGYPVEITFRDEKGSLTRVENGCATMRLKYDDGGNTAEVACLNEQGTESLTTSGSSIARSTYDAVGNRLMMAFWGLQSAPGLVGETYSSVRWTYTSFGKIERAAYFDSQGQPVKARHGFAAVTYEYDKSGNQSAVKYWDENGARVNSVEGISGIQKKFDARGCQVETAYVDPNDRPVRSAYGYASFRRECDERGYISLEQRLAEDGRPTTERDGFSAVTVKRNAAGQQLEVDYFDERMIPCRTRFGTMKRRWTYDATGRAVAMSELDSEGRPVVNAYGYSVLKWSYDEYGRENGRELLDAGGRKLAFAASIDRVEPHSVAADVGLMAGDVILTYDGEAVSTTEQFVNKLERFKGDRRRELTIRRSGRVLSIDLPPGRVDGLELEERVLEK